MKIDLRNVETRWINLDRATSNAQEMNEQFSALGFTKHKRISAKVLSPPKHLSPIRIKAYGSHYVGCGQSHIDALESLTSTPCLVLEDDAKVTPHFTPIIDVPNDTDAVYLGISHGNKRQLIVDCNNGWFRIVGMLATHSILYLSNAFKKAAKTEAYNCIYKKHTPLDTGFARLQANFKILAPQYPYFVQSDSRESLNKWEHLTSQPIVANAIIREGKVVMLRKEPYE